ncbi:DUF5134 domain-containing protein [Rhodococcus sp. IEGM 1401]|uniref:Unannotated protein n=2 Tax=root TaxID=1 RepID=A0A6J7ETZ3_9ZZZZ|nr:MULTISPECIES: DUF5134 domain-containing protein [Rhodococcus]MSX05350.1 DUF5134 domain-containing protein [Actinomycetota bacterium]KJV03576.1 hypothetical protein VF34_00936 [Rhodococcus sp. PML026]MBJ7323466.1 DUF5134 domain-containing protein [Rhodococcus sp. (in: high G+C Gram-positive bacteria)]MCJ0895214.1 DUF5134 domain-containing protein [Rhodococcus sp. ARC_M5]MCJ0980904.1 DUF5134 domain-containing protein [Rhodococcus sp. ARC_M12]
MIADSSLRWITTALFVFAAGYCVYRIIRAAQWNVRIDHGFHLVMCAAMIAMAWPWGLGVPLLPQGVFFAAATVWFAISAARTAPGTTGVDEHPHGPAMGSYHVFMMAAMVWMVAVMAGWLPGTAAHDHTADAADGDMSGMGAHAHTPDMDMSSPDHTAAMSGPGWISAVSLTLTVVFAVAAIVWLYRLFVAEQSTALAPVHPSPGSQAGNIAVDALPASRPQSVAAACEVAMAAGMAIMMGVV